MRSNNSKDCHATIQLFISGNIKLCLFIIVTEKIKNSWIFNLKERTLF